MEVRTLHVKPKINPFTFLYYRNAIKINCSSGRSSTLTCGVESEFPLKLVYELPFASLFTNAKGQRQFDASSVVIVGDHAYTIYDRSHAIGKVSVPHFKPFNKANSQFSLPNRGEQSSPSGYEAVFFIMTRLEISLLCKSRFRIRMGTFMPCLRSWP